MPDVRVAAAGGPLRPPRRVPRPRPALRAGVRPGGAQRGLSDTGVGKCLLRRLDAAVAHPTNHAMAALRSAVTDLVDRMRALGMPLDRIVVSVEMLLREHGTPCPRPSMHDESAAVVPARVFEWCVGAYRDDAWW
jgi:hypothetical protein